LKRLQRRELLRAGAGVALCLPLFESLLRDKYAQAAAPSRFVLIMQPLGVFPHEFWPLPPGAVPYQPGATFPIGETYTTGSTALDNSEFVLGPSLAPLAPHQRDVLVVEGLDAPHEEHGGFTSTTTGFNNVASETSEKTAGGPSIDKAISSVIGGATRFASLEFGIRSGDSVPTFNTASWYDVGKPAPCQNSGRVMFERLFGDGNIDSAALLRLQQERKSVLDTAMAQAAELRAGLSRQDQQKLDLYLEAFREVETKISTSRGCQAPEKPQDRDWTSQEAIDDLPAIASVQVSLLSLAMACDLTRVSYLQIVSEGSDLQNFEWLNVRPDGWHSLSHTNPGDPDWQAGLFAMSAITNWCTSVVSDVVTQLKELSAFDNTTVMFTNSMSHGSWHTNQNIPMVLVGNLGGYLKTGRHLRLPAIGGKRRSIVDLHAHLLKGFGGPDRFGDPSFANGPLVELSA
jgi:hypothetical protein